MASAAHQPPSLGMAAAVPKTSTVWTLSLASRHAASSASAQLTRSQAPKCAAALTQPQQAMRCATAPRATPGIAAPRAMCEYSAVTTFRGRLPRHRAAREPVSVHHITRHRQDSNLPQAIWQCTSSTGSSLLVSTARAATVARSDGPLTPCLVRTVADA